MEKINVLIFDEDEITKTLVESYLKELTFPFVINKYNEFDENIIMNNTGYNIIIVSVGRANIDVLEKISELSKNRKNKFIVVSNDNSTDLHVKVLRIGAKDFLLKPIRKSDFLYSVQSIYKMEIMGAQNKKRASTVFAVTSVDKGVGKTTFAINFSKELADASGEKVLLIDFNNTTNDVSFLLNVDILINTTYYMNKLDKENASSLLSKLNQYGKSNLYIMANGFSRSEEVTVNIRNVYNVIQILKDNFKYIVIDINKENDRLYSEVMSHSDIVWLIAQPSIPMFEKIKSAMSIATVRRNVRIVLNKYEKRHEANLETLQSIVGKQIYCRIPKNFIAVGSAQSKTKTIKEVSPEIDIVRAYTSLAKHIASKG